MTLDLNDLFIEQNKLDLEIAKLHHVTYESTRARRSLALLVELGELANETRCFKYWSLKEPSPKEKVLDEYADGLHFFISLGIDANIKSHSFEFGTYKGDLSEGFLKVYELASFFFNTRKEEDFIKAFSLFLSLYEKLGFKVDDIKKGYLLKLQVNHKRQENKY